MAKQPWLNVTPSSGSGNGTIANSAAPHTGRVARTSVVTVTGIGVTSPKTYNVTQSPKAEFAAFDSGEVAANKAGGTITITGKSNSQKLTFSLGSGGSIAVVLPTAYSANGANTNNAANITGDPGATSEFPFSVELAIPENTTVDERTKTVIVTAMGEIGRAHV